MAETLTREPVLVALGVQVRLLRARCGMTRRDLARQAGVSERYLANLEMGAGNSSILVLERLAQALGSTLINLLGDLLIR
jgi:XRE family transcriptional regulator, aerobic/anaerobic benzoate catabolism transcriptional regulator